MADMNLTQAEADALDRHGEAAASMRIAATSPWEANRSCFRFSLSIAASSSCLI